jgi:integrase/recombinase XerD
LTYQYKRQPLTADESNRLSNACESHTEKLVIWSLLDTGLRVSELAALKKDQIDWQQHVLRISGKGGPYGTQSKYRVVPMSERVRALIEGHFSLNNSIGIQPRMIQHLVHRVANRACISRPCTPHVLRHTFAVTALRKGIGLPQIQRVLGHDHVETTMIYLNLQPEDVIQSFRERW